MVLLRKRNTAKIDNIFFVMLVFINPDGECVYNLLNLTYMYLSWDRLSTNNSKMKGTDMSNHEKNEEE